MTALAWATLIFGFAAFSSFGFGIRFYFSKPQGKTLPMYLVSEVGIAICLVHLGLVAYHGVWHGHLSVRALALGLSLYLGSLAVYWWSIYTVRHQRLSFAYSEDMPQLLIEAGPYRYVRHPFYSAYTLCFLAAPLTLGSWWLLTTAAFMFMVYRQSAVMEERKFSDSDFGEQYRAYAARTGRFVPRLRALWS